MYKPHSLPLTDLGSRVLMHILVCTSYICILGSDPATAYLSRSPLRVEHRDCLASLVVCKQAPVVKCHNFTMPEASSVKTDIVGDNLLKIYTARLQTTLQFYLYQKL